MRVHLSLVILTSLVSPFFCQLKFGGSTSGSSSSSKNTRPAPSTGASGAVDADTKFFLPSTGNSAVDGGILGLGLGALGAAVLGPALTGGQQTGSYSACGRRKRQADGEQRFFLPSGGGCTCNDVNSGRKKRQATGENSPNTKFFGGLGNLLGGGTPHCGSCCYGSSNFGSSNNNFGSSNNNFGSSNNFGSQSQCQCDSSKTFQDQYGNTHGACRRADNTGKTWCYTTGWNNQGCRDLQSSSRFPNNPWSYRACSNQG